MKLANKIALITGAGSGIGRATAVRFAAEGAEVIATDLSLDRADAVAAEVTAKGQSALALRLDVTSESDWSRCLGEIAQRWERLDVLVASAGISQAAPLEKMTFEDWRRVLSINLDGVFLGMRAAIPLMRKAGKGSVVIVSSASGIAATPGASAYASSKAGLRGFAKSAAAELGPDSIRVNTVFPGAVRTPLWEAMPFFRAQVAAEGEEAAWRSIATGTPLGRVATAEEIADAILYLASDAANFVTGAELVIDGGYTA